MSHISVVTVVQAGMVLDCTKRLGVKECNVSERTVTLHRISS